MLIYCIYILSYVVTTAVPSASVLSDIAIIGGGFIIGIGGGFLWTEQGSYFARASEDHAKLKLYPSGSASVTENRNFTFAGKGFDEGCDIIICRNICINIPDCSI